MISGICGEELKMTVYLEPWMNRFTLKHLSILQLWVRENSFLTWFYISSIWATREVFWFHMSGDQVLSKIISFSSFSNLYIPSKVKKLFTSHLTPAVDRNFLLLYGICVGNYCQGVQAVELQGSWDLTLAEGHVIDIYAARGCLSHFKSQLDFILPYLWVIILTRIISFWRDLDLRL